MNDDDLAFLAALKAAIWQKHEARASWGNQRWESEARKLDPAELDRVLAIAHQQPCVLANACMGFGIGLALYAHPAFPGLPAECVFALTSRHLPGGPAVGPGTSRCNAGHDHFGAGWALFSPVALRPPNLAWCQALGLPVPSPNMGDYSY